jgi:uncharacterized linocin/CFP29 family protein
VSNLLNWADAPFDNEFWDMLDQTVRSVAQNQLSARHLLYSEGPYGLGLQVVPGKEREINQNKSEVTFSIAQGAPLVQLSTTFKIPARDIETHEQTKISLNFEELITRLLDITAQEEYLLYYGNDSSGLKGLLTESGIQHFSLKPWNEVGDAVESLIDAVKVLDNVGFHGPYSLALSSDRYNKLFRRYPQSDVLEMDHLKSLITGGIIKAQAISSGGVLVAEGKQFVSIILGQDLSAGFEGPSGRDYIFTLSETIALRVAVPSSVCVLDSV